jgi:hypothetical protein
MRGGPMMPNNCCAGICLASGEGIRFRFASMRFPAPVQRDDMVPPDRRIVVFAAVIERRIWAILLSVVATAHLILAHAGFGALGCPVRDITGVSCPGCGLTTAVLELLQGDWKAALHQHAFAPIFLGAIAIAATVAVLPAAMRHRACHAIATWERRTGISILIGAGLLIYWAARQLC